MDSEQLWPLVRSAPLTLDELRILAERAQDCAGDEGMRHDRSDWELRRGLWLALAQAAFACNAMLVRDSHFAMWGDPEGARAAGKQTPPAAPA